MLRIKDKDNRTKFILQDDDEEPISVDELILKDENQTQESSNERPNK